MTKAPLAWLLAACAFAAHAADPAATDKSADKPAKAPTAQQAKMKDCNATAKADGKKGDERKAFMKICLSSKKA